MPASPHPELLALLETISVGIGDVQACRAHGCAALSADGRAFVVVSDEGRIGVRLPDWDLFAAAFELPGSEPLYEDDQRVSHWVLLPEHVEDDRTALTAWLRHARGLTASRV